MEDEWDSLIGWLLAENEETQSQGTLADQLPSAMAARPAQLSRKNLDSELDKAGEENQGA